ALGGDLRLERVVHLLQALEGGLEEAGDAAAFAGVVAEPDVHRVVFALDVVDVEAHVDAQRRARPSEDDRAQLQRESVDLDVGGDDLADVGRVVETLDVDQVHRGGDVGQQVTVDIDRRGDLGHADGADPQVQDRRAVAVGGGF